MASSQITYRGFSTVSASSQKKFRLVDHALVKQDLLNALMTKPGSRVMQPTFGCVVWNKLFDNITPADATIIADDIQALIANDPRLNILNIDVTQVVNTLTITITLQYTDTNEIDTLIATYDSSL
jgi:phage baseplate assembly protein W